MITAAARKYMDASTQDKPKPKKPARHQRFGLMTVVMLDEVEIIIFHASLKGLEQAFRVTTRNQVHFDPTKVSTVTVSNRRPKKL